MVYKFSKEIYTKEAVIKSSYNFTDKAYIHIDTDSQYFIIDISMKDGFEIIEEKEFQNELLSQLVRQHVRTETKDIRKLILARAFASTVIEDYSDHGYSNEEVPNVEIHKILRDWFDDNE